MACVHTIVQRDHPHTVFNIREKIATIYAYASDVKIRLHERPSRSESIAM